MSRDNTFPLIPQLDNRISRIDSIATPKAVLSARQPATKAKLLASSLLRGMGAGNNIAGMDLQIDRAMPSVKEVFKDSRNTSSDVIKMRNDFSKEMSPTINAAKQVMARLLPNIKYLVPDKLYADVEKNLKSNKINADKTDEREIDDARANMITKNLEEIFKPQQEEHRLNTYINRSLDSTRHKETMGEMKGMRKELSFQSEFMRGPYTAYLKKSLELKYKHLFVSKDILASVNLINRIIEVKLEEIKHNTGLPDYTKMVMKDAFGSLLRKRFTESITDKTSNFINESVRNVGERLMPKLQQGGKKLLKKFKIGYKDDDIDMFNVKTKVTTAIDAWREKQSAKGGVMGFLADVFAPRFNEKQRSGGGSNKGGDPAIFDIAARQSMVEVMPGYLARITKILTDISTGKKDTEELVFDSKTHDFLPVSKLRSNIMSAAFGNKGERSSGIKHAIGQIKGAFASNVNPNMANLDKMLPDIAKIIANLAYHKLLLQPDLLKAYGEDENFKDSTGYIAKATKGLKNPKDVAYIMSLVLYRKDKIDKVAKRNINDSIIEQMKLDIYQAVIPKSVHTTGLHRHFKDIMDENGELQQDKVVANQTDFDYDSLAGESSVAGKDFSQLLDMASKQRNNSKLSARYKALLKRFAPVIKRIKGLKLPGMDDILGLLPKGKKATMGIIDTAMTKGKELKRSALEKANELKKSSLEKAAGLRKSAAEFGTQAMNTAADLGHTVMDKSEKAFHRVALEADKSVLKSFIGRTREIYTQTSAAIAEKYITFKEKIRLTQKPVVDKLSELIAFTKRAAKNGTEVVTKALTPKQKAEAALKEKEKQAVEDKLPKTKEEFLAGIFKAFTEYQEYRKSTDLLTFGQLTDITSILQQGFNHKGPLTVKDIMKKKLSVGGKAIGGLATMYTTIYAAAFKAAGSVGTAAVEGIGKGAIKLGPKAFKLVGQAGTALSSLLQSYFGLYGKAAVQAGGVLSSIFARSKTEKYVDIYLKDKVSPGNPLLSARQQEDGVIYKTGKPVKRSADIKEPVFDPKTKRALITKANIKHGLVDISNKAIGSGVSGTSLMGKITDTALDATRNVLKFLTGATGTTLETYHHLVRQGIDLAHGGLKGVGRGIGRLLGMDKGKIENLGEVTSRMDKMLGLLKTISDAVGGGIRENSYTDQKRKRTPKTWTDKHGKVHHGTPPVGAGAAAMAAAGKLGGGAGAAKEKTFLNESWVEKGQDVAEAGVSLKYAKDMLGKTKAGKSALGWIEKQLARVPKVGKHLSKAVHVGEEVVKKLTPAQKKAAQTASKVAKTAERVAAKTAKAGTSAAGKTAGKAGASAAGKAAGKLGTTSSITSELLKTIPGGEKAAKWLNTKLLDPSINATGKGLRTGAEKAWKGSKYVGDKGWKGLKFAGDKGLKGAQWGQRVGEAGLAKASPYASRAWNATKNVSGTAWKATKQWATSKSASNMLKMGMTGLKGLGTIGKTALKLSGPAQLAITPAMVLWNLMHDKENQKEDTERAEQYEKDGLLKHIGQGINIFDPMKMLDIQGDTIRMYSQVAGLMNDHAQIRNKNIKNAQMSDKLDISRMQALQKRGASPAVLAAYSAAKDAAGRDKVYNKFVEASHAGENKVAEEKAKQTAIEKKEIIKQAQQLYRKDAKPQFTPSAAAATSLTTSPSQVSGWNKVPDPVGAEVGGRLHTLKHKTIDGINQATLSRRQDKEMMAAGDLEAAHKFSKEKDPIKRNRMYSEWVQRKNDAATPDSLAFKNKMRESMAKGKALAEGGTAAVSAAITAGATGKLSDSVNLGPRVKSPTVAGQIIDAFSPAERKHYDSLSTVMQQAYIEKKKMSSQAKQAEEYNKSKGLPANASVTFKKGVPVGNDPDNNDIYAAEKADMDKDLDKAAAYCKANGLPPGTPLKMKAGEIVGPVDSKLAVANVKDTAPVVTTESLMAEVRARREAAKNAPPPQQYTEAEKMAMQEQEPGSALKKSPVPESAKSALISNIKHTNSAPAVVPRNTVSTPKVSAQQSDATRSRAPVTVHNNTALHKLNEKQVSATENMSSGIGDLRALLERIVKNTEPIDDIRQDLSANLKELASANSGPNISVASSSRKPRVSTPAIGAKKLQPAFI